MEFLIIACMFIAGVTLITWHFMCKDIESLDLPAKHIHPPLPASGIYEDDEVHYYAYLKDAPRDETLGAQPVEAACMIAYEYEPAGKPSPPPGSLRWAWYR